MNTKTITNIQFSLDSRYRAKLQDLSEPSESLGLCAKRLLLDYLDGGQPSQLNPEIEEIEERLSAIENKLREASEPKEPDRFQKILEAIQELKVQNPGVVTQNDSSLDGKILEIEARLSELETNLTKKAIALIEPLLKQHAKAKDVDQALEVIQEQIANLKMEIASDTNSTAGDDSVQNRYPVEIDQEDVQRSATLTDAEVARHLKCSKTTAANLRKGLTNLTDSWQKKITKAGLSLKNGFWLQEAS